MNEIIIKEFITLGFGLLLLMATVYGLTTGRATIRLHQFHRSRNPWCYWTIICLRASMATLFLMIHAAYYF